MKTFLTVLCMVFIALNFSFINKQIDISYDSFTLNQDSSKIFDILPDTRFMDQKWIDYYGEDKGIYCWGAFMNVYNIMPPMDDKKVGDFRLLIQNNGSKPINISPTKISLKLNDGTEIQPFKGQEILGTTLFITSIGELNGEDISKKNKKSIILRELDFTLIFIYFEVGQDDTEETMKNKIKSINVTILSGGKQKILHVLKF